MGQAKEYINLKDLKSECDYLNAIVQKALYLKIKPIK
jgi:hypothetical protein